MLQHPAYASKYPPGQSLAMASGEALFGDPWLGVWLSCAVMIAALVWALQGWLPPVWTILGGLLVLPLAINSYWMNSYWGGAVAATGGALVLGGYARVVRRKQIWYSVAIGVGIAILANTRPYEGLIFCIPVAIAFLTSRPKFASIALIGAVLLPAFVATGYYNRAVTGNAFELPFTEYARQYARIPLFNFQKMQPEKTISTAAMYDLHENWEPSEWRKARSWQLARLRYDDWSAVAGTILGSVVMGGLIVIFLPHLWRDRRVRLPSICVATALAGSFIEVRFYEHYFAPATVALLILAVQSLRHLRQWQFNGEPVGRFLARAIPILILASAVATRVHEGLVPPLHYATVERGILVTALGDMLDKHVIIVRYTGHQSPHEEWVYNGADIDGQSVIWAHDLGPAENAALLDYYKDRKFWLFQPDINPTKLDPYR